MNHPLVSILIPIRNESAYIEGCLEAVLHQDYPKDRIEILIVDGMSNDATRQIIQKIQEEHSAIQLLDNRGRIVPIGMNIALRQARGDIVIRVDGHCIIARDYVRKCVDHLKNDGVDGVGGPMKTIGVTPFSEVIAVAMSSKFGVGNSAFRTTTGKDLLVDSIPFPAYTRSTIQKAGLYDEELERNQDDEYNYRIRELGGKLLLAGDVKSVYYSRGSIVKLWKQYFQYGFYKIRVLQKHPGQMSLRQYIPSLFILGLLVSVVLSLTTSWGWRLTLLSLCIYLFANIYTSLKKAIKNKNWKLLLLPVIFPVLHISYGSGFLIGLFKFWNRWRDKKGSVPVWNTDDVKE